MKLEKGGIQDCHLYPDRYTLCSPYTCVPADTPCPCKDEEYQCPNEICIPKTYICNGRNDCENGFDELTCNRSVGESGDVSVSVVISISVLSIVLCILSVILLLLYIRRKYRRPAESVDEPLQAGNSSDSENTENDQPKPDINILKTNNTKNNKHQNIPGYVLVSNIDDIGDFGDGLLCASTPKQGVRQIPQMEINFTGNTSAHVSSGRRDLPDLVLNTSSGNCAKTVKIHRRLQSIPYIDSSMEIINVPR